MQFSEDDPRHHTAKIKDMMSQAMRHARADIAKVSDPEAQARSRPRPRCSVA